MTTTDPKTGRRVEIRSRGGKLICRYSGTGKTVFHDPETPHHQIFVSLRRLSGMEKQATEINARRAENLRRQRRREVCCETT